MAWHEPLPIEPRASHRRWWAAVECGLTALTLWASLERPAAAADPDVAELEYDRPASLDTCPDEAMFRRAVTSRLRRDPFVVGAARKISVVLTRSGATLTARVRVEEGGRARGERRIETRAGCAELASGAALAVSIAIDPLAALGSPNDAAEAPAEPAIEPAPTANGARRPEPTKSSENSRKKAATVPLLGPREGHSSRLFARAGMRSWVGVVPGIGTGPTLGVGYQHGLGSLALDLVSVLPRTETVAASRRAVSVALLGAALSPCLHLGDFRACALLSSGALFARGEGVDATRTGTSWHAAAGLGVGYSFFVGRFFFAPSVDASARFTTTRLALDDELVWATPRLLGSFGLEIGYDLAP